MVHKWLWVSFAHSMFFLGYCTDELFISIHSLMQLVVEISIWSCAKDIILVFVAFAWLFSGWFLLLLDEITKLNLWVCFCIFFSSTGELFTRFANWLGHLNTSSKYVCSNLRSRLKFPYLKVFFVAEHEGIYHNSTSWLLSCCTLSAVDLHWTQSLFQGFQFNVQSPS